MRFCSLMPWLGGVALILCWLLQAPDASAERKYSRYERDSIAAALLELGEPEREFSPEGKRIEGIQVVTLDVIEPRDPAPNFFNWFHSTSRESVIRQEVLLTPGRPYTQALAEETERNLRVLPQLSVVLIVPLKGTHPDSVKILVVTKDVWSLRMATQPSFQDFKVTGLAVQPSETNLFGTHHVFAGNVLITPDNYWLGATYVYPRIGNSRIRGRLNANAIFNCDSGELEGATGSLLYGQPLYSSFAKWSWQVITNWSSAIGRPLTAAQQRQVRSICSGGQPQIRENSLPLEIVPLEGGQELRSTRQVATPIAFRRESLSGQFVLTRSFFRWNKLDVSTGVQARSSRLSWLKVRPEETRRRRVEAIFDDGEQISDTSVIPLDFDAADLAAVLQSRRPSGERRISPYVQLHGYANRWLQMINYNTLGLQESWRMGHEFYLRVFPSFHPLSSHDVLGSYASLAYSWPINGRGFFRALAAAHLQVGTLVDGFEDTDFDAPVQEEEQRRPAPSLSIADTEYRVGMHFASPDFGIGRLALDVSARYRPLRTFFGAVGTGGTDRLRGFNSFEFVNNGTINTNVELRTRPLQVLSILGGLALFYDAGGAFDLPIRTTSNGTSRELDFDGGHSLGFGFRLLSPQLDRAVFRIDFGFPLEPRGGSPFGFIARFDHAFIPPFSSPPALLTQ